MLYDYHTLKYITDVDKDCSLKTVQLHTSTVICVTSRKSWTWKRRIDTTISHMVESGEVDHLHTKWFGKGSCTAKNNFYSLDIVQLKDLFIILGISAVISTFILLIEVIWSYISCIARYFHRRKK